MFTSTPGNCRTGDHALQAAMFAASAEYGRVQINCHVTALGGGAGAAMKDPPVLNNCGANSRPNRYVENRATIGAGPPYSFSQSRGIRVIFHANGKTILLF